MNQTIFPIHWMPLPKSQGILSLTNQPISCEEVWTENLYLPWQSFYTDYVSLKAVAPNDLWVQRLQAEWDKVYRFYSNKKLEIQESIDSVREQADIGSHDFFEIISKDIYHLHQFLKVNYRGFLHLFMLHDLHYEKSTYEHSELQNYFWDEASQAVHKLAIDVSYLSINNRYSTLNAYLENVIQTPLSANQVNSKSYQAIAQKYWVHPDHLLELMLLFSKELSLVEDPSTCFRAETQIKHSSYQQSSKELIVSTIYLDTDLFEDYRNSLELIETTQSDQTNTEKERTVILSRLRSFAPNKSSIPPMFALEQKACYSKQDNSQHYIHKRIHVEQKYLDTRVQGCYSLDGLLNNPLMQYQEEESVAYSFKNEMKQAYTQWEADLRKTSRKPVFHVTQNRIVYASQDQSVFITIDTDITMMRILQSEGLGHSFGQLNTSKGTQFPYCVVQVHGELEEGSKLHHTFMQLIENHLLYAVDHFSIYLHGIATLFADRVDRIPYWFPLLSELPECNHDWLNAHFSRVLDTVSTRPTSSRSSSTLYHDRICSSATVSTTVTCFENDSDSEDNDSSKQQHHESSMPRFHLKQDMSFLRPTWYQKRTFRRSFDSVCSFDHPTSSRSDPTNCRDCMIYVSHGDQDELDEWTGQQPKSNALYSYQDVLAQSSSKSREGAIVRGKSKTALSFSSWHSR
ncbi:VTC domain-containing protein [Blakeslea trispora]|nr:VTC domain-containing protein [Blakeslea trispora]